MPCALSPVEGAVRTNLTVLSPPDVTTKLNEPGTGLTAHEIVELEDLLLARADHGDLVMLSGSLAPGMPADEYAHLVRLLHERGAWAGVDTSDAPLTALASAFANDPASAPDFLKPNAHELGQIIGADGDALEAGASRGDLAPIAEAAAQLRARGVREVLVTLGGAGAFLAADEGTFFAAPVPPERVVSTVGAGDSATAGYLIGLATGEDAPARLARAVAYGTAAVALPGTTIPRPDQVRIALDRVRPL